jgi:hypothetical protein
MPCGSMRAFVPTSGCCLTCTGQSCLIRQPASQPACQSTNIFKCLLACLMLCCCVVQCEACGRQGHERGLHLQPVWRARYICHSGSADTAEATTRCGIIRIMKLLFLEQTYKVSVRSQGHGAFQSAHRHITKFCISCFENSYIICDFHLHSFLFCTYIYRNALILHHILS